MKQWKGKWVIAVAVLHTLFALVSFGPKYLEILRAGFIGGVNSLETALAAWFLLFGALLFALGQSVYYLEQSNTKISTSLAACLLLLTLVGVSLMPVSGFWLLFPPIIALFIEKESTPVAVES